ncbi:ice2 family protein [Moniliophthora roreri MCA 2997]|uniref:Ice2 family protein n=1 Tax=Moniliophthora roreri (strain MCA 2997) TaxID=1381753 RepID=V2XVY1_MONRO|nr:ice2 family protein [Moniliophthora roreri MCA 2997]
MSSMLWNVVSHTAKLSTAVQILIFLPLTLATLSKAGFLLLSLLLAFHAVIHGTLILLWGSQSLSVLQVPVHPFLLIVSFNFFSSEVHPWLLIATQWWGKLLTFSGPFFIVMEGLSSLLVAQKLGQEGKKLVEKGEGYQTLLIASSVTYVVFCNWIVSSYSAAASSPLSSTFLGVALTALVFLTFIGFFLRRTNIIESSALALCIAYNVWLCGFDQQSFSDPVFSYVPLLPNVMPHFQALMNFVTNTLPKPVLIALLYRLTIMHLASRILPNIGADSWGSEDGVDNGWEDRPTSTLTRIILTYRQLLFVMVYSHLLLLDHSSQIWWRWINIFFTLTMWAVELLVTPDDDVVTKEWKVD